MCLAKELETIECLATADLKRLYQKQLGVETRPEFGNCKELTFYRCCFCDLRFFWPLKTGSAVFYQQLHHHDWYYLTEKSEYITASEWLKSDDRVLDVGCGYGFFASHVDKAGCRQFTGLELTETAARAAATKGLDVRQQTIEEHARLCPDHYDVVCSFQVLEHVGGIRSFIESSLACLRPGGSLIFSVPSADSFVGRVRNGVLNLPPHHVSWWSDQSLRNLAKLFRVELVEIRPEPLEEIHCKTYSLSLAVSALEMAFSQRGKLIDQSAMHRVISFLALPAALATYLSVKLGLVEPRGHSVTAVYRKLE
ncbi:MAG: class I SAM-dependent methyltransferase [Acidobacteriota bacterium]|nr:class I SAM-dependent methyltransferase [Acidobacteriota bacterium]